MISCSHWGLFELPGFKEWREEVDRQFWLRVWELADGKFSREFFNQLERSVKGMRETAT